MIFLHMNHVTGFLSVQITDESSTVLLIPPSSKKTSVYVFGIVFIFGHIYIIRGQPRFHSSALTANYDNIYFPMFIFKAMIFTQLHFSFAPID